MVKDYFEKKRVPNHLLENHLALFVELVLPKRKEIESIATEDHVRMIKIMRGIFNQEPNDTNLRLFLTHPAITEIYSCLSPSRRGGVRFKESSLMREFLETMTKKEYDRLAFLLADKVQITDLLPEK
jgi:hypothetical protein